MKHKFLITTLCATLMGISTANAGFYAGIGAGAAINEGSVTYENIALDYKNSPIYSAAVGYELPLPILDVRGEVEYLRVRPEINNGQDSKFDGIFLNGYTDIPFVPFVDPYVGAGVGYSRFDHNNSTAYQGMVGVEYGIPFIPLSLAAEYRYMKVTETGGKWDANAKFHTNTFMIKARFSF